MAYSIAITTHNYLIFNKKGQLKNCPYLTRKKCLLYNYHFFGIRIFFSLKSVEINTA